MGALKMGERARAGAATMDKKRLEYYKKKLQTRREELLKSIARTEEEGRTADDDPTVDLADKAANSYTKEFLVGQTAEGGCLHKILQIFRSVEQESSGARQAVPFQGRFMRCPHGL